MTPTEIIAALEQVRETYRLTIEQCQAEQRRLNRLERGMAKSSRQVNRILKRVARATRAELDAADWWKGEQP